MGFADGASVDDLPAGRIRHAGADGIENSLAEVREHLHSWGHLLNTLEAQGSG